MLIIRLFDEDFELDDVRTAMISLTINGDDGFQLKGSSGMKEIGRDLTELRGMSFCLTVFRVNCYYYN